MMEETHPTPHRRPSQAKNTQNENLHDFYSSPQQLQQHEPPAPFSAPPRVMNAANILNNNRPSSARNVLRVAGRPLRNVGRRLRFHRDSSANNMTELEHSSSHRNHNNINRNNYQSIGDEHNNDDSISEEEGSPLRMNGSKTMSNSRQLRGSLVRGPLQDENPELFPRSLEWDNAHAASVASTPPRSLTAVPTGSPTTAGSADTTTADLWIVVKLETALRSLVCLLAAYLLGAYCHAPTVVFYATKTLEYTMVAWFTSALILLLIRYSSSRSIANTSRSTTSTSKRPTRSTVHEEEKPLLLADEEEGRLDIHENHHYHPQVDGRNVARVQSTQDEEANADVNTEPVVLVQVEEEDDEEEEIMPRRHPSFSFPANGAKEQSLYIIDTATLQRIALNQTEQPYKLETEYFTGEVVVLVRTPDVDEPTACDNNNTAPHVLYLKDKLRRFEFQFQVRLKKVPTGRVYFSCELLESVKLGLIPRAFVGAAMAFVKTTNNNFSYSFTRTTADPGGNSGMSNANDRPHMAFPVEEGMNRVVATPPGQEPPTLGGEIFEDENSIKQRKKGAQIQWNLQDTYTLSLWSAYVDFLDWNVLNLPGLRSFDLTNVIALQHINLTLYEVLPETNQRKGIAQLELSNASRSQPGPAAVQWAEQHQVGRTGGIESSQLAATSSNDDLNSQSVQMTEEAEEYEADLVEEEKVAQLGEGIYVKSGDSITLRESLSSSDEDSTDGGCFVTYAGGFAVLQEQSPATVIIEKVYNRSQSSKSSRRSKLIKSGDSVLFKLVTSKGGRNNDEVETRYLSVHKGWWVKWVPIAPKNNGVFTIYTHETECSDDGPETQASYLTLGGSFWLRHRRWTKYQVGAAAEGSATYGGRMLGLYSPKTNYDDDMYATDDGQEPEQLLGGEKSRSAWLRPLQLRAYEASMTAIPLKRSSEEALVEEVVDNTQLVFSSDNLRMDVPAWLEMMNRKDRIQQLTFAVRISPQNGVDSAGGTKAFIRLRTGRQLSHIMRVGLNWRNSVSTPRKRAWSDGNAERFAAPIYKKSLNQSLSSEIGASMDELDENNALWMDDEDSLSEGESRESGDELDANLVDVDEEAGSLVDLSDPLAPNRPKRSQKFIGKLKSKTKSAGKKVVNQTVKVGTAGKKVVNQTVKVGKGVTVSALGAGKAIIAPRPKNPPSKEPKASTAPKRNRKRIERDLHSAVTRSMKRMEKEEYRSPTLESPTVLAAELSAPEQSCRTVSNMLAKMSSLPASSAMSNTFSNLLASEMSQPSEQEEVFLSGGAMQLGVVPREDKALRGKNLHGCLVARCLWESHWREEWCGLNEKMLSFYAPLSDSPCLELSLEDIQNVRDLEAGSNPLPGYPVMVVEASWMCHYLAFSNIESRTAFRLQIDEAMARFTEPASTTESTLWQARFWQGFQTSLNSTFSSGRGKWADVASGTKMKPRLILNNRRMVFDLVEPESAPEFVEQLLESALSFSQLGHLREHPEALIRFLDATSQLRRLSLHSLDLSSASAFCVFVNLYHCLLQHAMLLSVNGPLHKRSFGHFMRTSCYEIGGDAFSLAELHSQVIRGNMSRPSSTKPPAVVIPKKSYSHRFYALGYITNKVIFLLNTGDTACPREVPILTPSQLDVQLNIQTAEFLQHNVFVDLSRRLILLPKVCQVYSRFDVNMCLRYCLSFLDDESADAIQALLEDAPSAIIKYRAASDQYHTTLRLRDYGSQTDTGFEVPIQI